LNLTVLGLLRWSLVFYRLVILSLMIDYGGLTVPEEGTKILWDDEG
jgi:hypothetical protein